MRDVIKVMRILVPDCNIDCNAADEDDVFSVDSNSSMMSTQHKPSRPKPNRPKAHFGSYMLDHALNLNNEGVKLACDKARDKKAAEQFSHAMEEFEQLVANANQGDNGTDYHKKKKRPAPSPVGLGGSNKTRLAHCRSKNRDHFLFNKLITFVRHSDEPCCPSNYQIFYSAVLFNVALINHGQAILLCEADKYDISKTTLQKELAEKAERYYMKCVETISAVCRDSSTSHHGAGCKPLKPGMMVKLAAINNLSQLRLERAQEGFLYLEQLAEQSPRNSHTDNERKEKTSSTPLLNTSELEGMLHNSDIVKGRRKIVKFAI